MAAPHSMCKSVSWSGGWDIGDSCQLGLVKCMEEKERDWLEVMELLGRMVSIQSPQVGQLVAFVLQTRVETRVAGE